LKAVRACEVDPPSAVTRGIPRHVDALVLKALGKRPADRFASADAMREALDELIAGLRSPDVVGWYQELDDVPGLDDDESHEHVTSSTVKTPTPRQRTPTPANRRCTT